MEPGAAISDKELLYGANVFVTGEVNFSLQKAVVEQLRLLRENGEAAIVEVTTQGGDAEAGRRIACEIRLFQHHAAGDIHVIGRTTVYSAGVTIFAALPPEARFLTSDTMLLVHERREDRTLSLSGPTSSCIQIVQEELASLQAGYRLEEEGFEQFVRGSSMDVKALREQARENWYISAEEARNFGLINRVIECGARPSQNR